MVVNFTTLLGDGGEIPPEINQFIAALRVEPVLNQRFPTVDVTGLQARAAQGNQRPAASYSVVCKPAAAPKPGTSQGVTAPKP